MTVSLGKLTLEQAFSALLTLLVCLVVMRVVMALMKRLTARVSWEERVKKYVLTGMRALLYVLTGLIVASSLGIDVTSLIALVGVFGLAISLAVQDVLANVAGGLVILFSKPFGLGDYVATADGEGEVAEISLTHTKLDTFDGLRVMLPNSKLVASKITNYSVRGVRRVNHIVTASYDSDSQVVREACLEAVKNTKHVLADPAPEVVVTSYGDSAVAYSVRFWTKTEHYWEAHNFSLEEIRRCFARKGVTMTYNHLNVHILDNTKEK